MQIEHNISGNYKTKITGNSQTEQTKSAESSRQTNSGADLSGLKEGAVFKGEILNINGEKVTIALENKAELSARLQEGIQLGVGDKLLFSVQENKVSQILIKPMFDSLYSAQTQVLEKALDVAGLSPSEKNFSVAKQLMDSGLSLDKGNMVKLLSQSMRFPDTPMQTLGFLNQMGIPVTAENIAQYIRYQGYQHQITGDIVTAADAMASFVSAMPEDASGSVLRSLTNQILELFAGEHETAVKNGPAGEETVFKMTETAAENINNKSGADAEENIQGRDESVRQAPTDSETVTDPVLSRNNNPLSMGEEQTGFSKEQLSGLADMLRHTGVAEGDIQSILQNTDSKEQFLKDMMKLPDLVKGSDVLIRSVLDSSEFKKLFADVIKQQWALNPKEMKEPKEIDELYNRIIKQSRAFEEVVASKGGDSKSFNQNFQNMRQNMQFMEQLNQQMIYAQMPLKLSNQNANSELFVYADKRKLASKKDGISVMLHLDMDHLGMTDIKVTLTGTNVNARFYLNDQESVDIVVDNMAQLATQLADRGFSLSNEVIKREPQDSINQVVDEIIDENAEQSIKRYTFDART